MSETMSNFTGAMRKVIHERATNRNSIKELLYAYEKGKKKHLQYTANELSGLRKILGINSHEKFLGNVEVQALQILISERVSNILNGENTGIFDKKKPKSVPTEKLRNAPVPKIPHVVFIEGGSINKAEAQRTQHNYEKCKVQIWPIIQKIASLVGLRPKKILAICAQESRFDLWAVSKMGAQGLMQVMPGTSAGVTEYLKSGTKKNAGPEEAYYAKVRELAKEKGFDINTYLASSSALGKNIVVGIIYLSYLLKNHKSDMALQIYNGGNGKSLESKQYASGVKAWEKAIFVSNMTETNVA